MNKKELSLEDKILLKDAKTFFYAEAFVYAKEQKLSKEREMRLMTGLDDFYKSLQNLGNEELIRFFDHLGLTSKSHSKTNNQEP